MAEINLEEIDNMDIVILPTDKVTMVPYGLDGIKKITIAQMIQSKEFKSLDPVFARRVLQLIRDYPTFGILQGGAGRSEDAVTAGFYFNYRIMSKQKDYENNPAYYKKISAGLIKWNPEDKKWYKRVTDRTVAVPGGSWHTGGYAVDFTGDYSKAVKVAEKYGLKQILGQGEFHHFQPAGLPTSKRMFQYLRERYGLDPVKNPLPQELIDWIDSEVASNVPRQPTRILSQLDPRIAAYKQSIAPKPIDILTNALNPKKVSTYNFGVDPLPAEPSTTTTRPSTTTTTTIPATTTTQVEQTAGSKKATTTTSAAPKTTTTTAAPRTTTTSTTVVPKTTTTSTVPVTTSTVPVTTSTLPTATSTPMAPKPKNNNIVEDDGTTPAGGVDPDYIPPNAKEIADPEHLWKKQDWQMILSMPQADVIKLQKYLMKAFPGFQPGQLGNKYDPKTQKYFKSALGRINQFSSDVQDEYALGIRGKSVLESVKILGSVPMIALSDSSSGTTAGNRVTSPTDLKAIFTKASQDMLGRTIGEGDLNRMIAAYQASEVKYQNAYSSGADATQNADPTTFAQNKIQQDFGKEVDVNKLDNIFSVIDKALSAGGQR